MNKTKVKPSTGEGWAVHVYDSDRHLRFTLEPSHIWAFGWGIGVGLLLAIIWSALHGFSHSFSSNTATQTNFSSTPEASSGEDLSPEPTNSFPFGID
ncbi:MAG: hypothetical protein ACFCAD_24695 [Pleurocapsa sp.]